MSLKFVQGDTKPALFVALKTRTGLPIDVSASNAVVKLRIRIRGGGATKETITGTKKPGLLTDDGTLDTTGVYATAGRGGCVEFPWTSTSLDTPGAYEGEVEITYGDGSVQTVFDVIKFQVRQQF